MGNLCIVALKHRRTWDRSLECMYWGMLNLNCLAGAYCCDKKMACCLRTVLLNIRVNESFNCGQVLNKVASLGRLYFQPQPPQRECRGHLLFQHTAYLLPARRFVRQPLNCHGLPIDTRETETRLKARHART